MAYHHQSTSLSTMAKPDDKDAYTCPRDPTNPNGGKNGGPDPLPAGTCGTCGKWRS